MRKEEHNFSIFPEKKMITSDDRYSLITYRLKMKHDVFKGQSPKAILFYIQGSRYETVLSEMGFLAGVVAMNISVIMLERRGIDENYKEDLNTIHKYSTKEFRVKDTLKVINEYLKGVPLETPVILMGVSEGGNIAVVVASREKRVTHLVLLVVG